MDVSELLYRVREEVPEASGFVVDARIVDSLNRGYQYVARRSYGLRGEFTSPQVAIDAIEFSIPNYILAFLTTTWLTAAGDTSTVVTKLWTDAVPRWGAKEMEDPQATSATPSFLFIYGNTSAHFHPKPSAVGYLKGTAIMLPTNDVGNPFQKLSATTDKPALQEDLHECIVSHATAELLARSPARLPQAQQYRMMRDEGIGRIIDQQDDLPMEPVRVMAY